MQNTRAEEGAKVQDAQSEGRGVYIEYPESDIEYRISRIKHRVSEIEGDDKHEHPISNIEF